MDLGIKPIAALILTAVISLSLWLVYREGVKVGRGELLVEWQAERIAQSRARADAMLKAREREQTLRETIDQLASCSTCRRGP